MNKFPFLVLVFCCLFVTVFCFTASADTISSEPEQTVSELVSEVKQFDSEVSIRLEEQKETAAAPVPSLAPEVSASPEPVTLSTVNDTLFVIAALIACLLGVLVCIAFVHFLWR